MASPVNLENKLVPPDRIAEYALEDQILFQELLKGVSPQSQKSARRENCSQALMYMAETWPEMLLPQWDYFVSLFKSDNGSSKYVAIYITASLAKADQKDVFTQYYEDYFALLDDESVMVASHAALNAARIYESCFSLRPRIVERLLQIDQTHHDAGHLALVKAYVIEALESIYPTSEQQNEIMEFVTKQVESESPKTQKLAKGFVKKWGKPS